MASAPTYPALSTLGRRRLLFRPRPSHRICRERREYYLRVAATMASPSYPFPSISVAHFCNSNNTCRVTLSSLYVKRRRAASCLEEKEHCQPRMGSREGEGGAGTSARPALRVGRTREYRTGTDTELLAIDGVAGTPVSLFVLCGDRFEEAQPFRTGGLSVHMVRVEGHPVSMASCTVGDHEWMLAHDALVARLEARVFVFELPGFFYAVVVPPDAAGGAGRKCATMAEIFSRFCKYHDLIAPDDEAGDLNHQHTDPWVRAHDSIQRLKGATSPAGHAIVDAPFDRARQMERGVRTSAVVKLLSRSLLAGVLQPSQHLTITHGGAAANADTASLRAASAAAALPSKSVVSDLLDAIETNRAALRRDARRGPDGGLGWWSLNVEGVMLLLRIVQAVREKKLLVTSPGDKRPRDEGPAWHDRLRGGNVVRGGGAMRSAMVRREAEEAGEYRWRL